MKSPIPALALVLTVLLTNSAFSQNRSRWLEYFLHEIEKAPASEREKQNPYEGQPQAIAAGQKLFRQHCVQCHGKEGWGTERAPGLHSASLRRAAPGEVAWFLKNGNLRGGMPPWSRLPDQRRWQLVTYLKSLHYSPGRRAEKTMKPGTLLLPELAMSSQDRIRAARNYFFFSHTTNFL